MKIITPDHYAGFSCIADRCRHSCCIGWEIDINDAALQRFSQIESISRHITSENGAACFRMGADERCPFLNRDGLCDMILQYGDDMLCDICADHPRYRNYFSDRTEIGLGLCCEAAARLILNRTEPMCFLQTQDGTEEDPLTEDEEDILALRRDLIAIAQDRSIPISARIRRLQDEAEIEMPPMTNGQIAELLLGLERLEPVWTEHLEQLAVSPQIPADLPASIPETAYEQLIVSLLWRHIAPAAEDGDAEGHIAFCLFAWELITRLLNMVTQPCMEDLVEICREFSAEIEYSDENIGIIMDTLEEKMV